MNCGAVYEEARPLPLFGCPKCRTPRFASNLSLRLELDECGPVAWERLISEEAQGIWRYSSLLPVQSEFQLSLGEGNTPLLKLDRLGEQLGLRQLYLKDESQNPTWSHKDRMMAVAVSKAVELGFTVITTASTGNHAASTAAYAAKAGLPCVTFTVSAVPDTMRTYMQVYGALVLALPDYKDRWPVQRECIAAYDWFPTGNTSYPLIIGSVFYAVEGPKTIAFEIFEQLDGQVPDVVVVPVAFGDNLYGIWKGFLELRQLKQVTSLPRMIAVEPLGPVANAFFNRLPFPEAVPYRSTPAFSSAAYIGTFQGLKGVRDSGGTAVVISDDSKTMRMQQMLAGLEGIYGEAASSTALAALGPLIERREISRDTKIVCISTSSGLKDPTSTAVLLPRMPFLRGNESAEEIVARIHESYGVGGRGTRFLEEVAEARLRHLDWRHEGE